MLFLERGEGKEKEGEKHQCVVASHAPPNGNLARAIQACALTWNQTNRPFGSQAGTQFAEPHQPQS